jgi:hypothetical protein
MRHLFIKIAFSAICVLLVLPAHAPTSAQEPMVLTVVATDGSLWALMEGQPPTLLRRDLGKGAAVTDLSWSPTEPQLLIVRRETRAGEPYDSLVRVDLRSGDEEVVEENVGPQARLLRPAWRPNGMGGIARVECCLDRQLTRFDFPTPPSSPHRIGAADFLPNEQRDVALAEAGFINSAGEIIISVHCCMGDEPEDNPAGIYAISEDFQSSRRLAAGDLGLPIGSPGDESWLATLLPRPEGDGHGLVVVELDGSSSELESPADLPLSDHGVVLPDGTIAVSTLPAGVASLTPRYVDVWAFSPTDTPARKLTEGYKSGITAFGFVPASLLRQIPGQAGAPFTPTRISISRSPESDEDFTAVFR